MNEDRNHNTSGKKCGASHASSPAIKARSVIVFGLICQDGHEFEGWFRSNQDFDDQCAKGALSCPACHTTRVEKGILAANFAEPAIGDKGRPYGDTTDLTDNDQTIAQLEAEIFEMRRQIKEELRVYADAGLDHSGTDFPEFESYEDMVSLIDEGTSVDPQPEGSTPSSRKKLN